jgi:hypothetical protein
MNLDSNTKKVVAAVVVVAVLVVGAFAGGRYSAPDKIVTRTEVKTVATDRVVTQVDTDKILDALKTLNVQKDVHVVRVVEKEKDGTTKVTTTTDDKSKSESSTQTQDKTQTETKKAEEKIVYQDRVETKIVERTRPQWGFTLQPGFDFAGALGHPSYSLLPSTIPVQHLVIGVGLDRRILGPLSVGVWVNSAGVGGLNLRLEF